MLKLYFGSVSSMISTVLILVFAVFFGVVMTRRSSITHWGILVLLVFMTGLFMSIMSGTKDGIGSASSVIPSNHWSMAALCILGGLSFLIAIIALFVRRQDFWQICFYTLSAVIIIKILLTEGYRVYSLFKLPS